MASTPGRQEEQERRERFEIRQLVTRIDHLPGDEDKEGGYNRGSESRSKYDNNIAREKKEKVNRRDRKLDGRRDRK